MGAMPMERHELDDEEAAALKVLAARIPELCRQPSSRDRRRRGRRGGGRGQALTARLARHRAPPYAVSGTAS